MNFPGKLNDLFNALSAHEAIRQGDPVAANRVVLKWSADALGVKMASLRFFSKDRLQLRCMEQYQQPTRWLSGGPDFKTGEVPRFFLAVDGGGIIAVTDVENDQRTEDLHDRFLHANGIVSLLSVPVRILGDLVGILIFKHEGDKRVWTGEEMAFAGDAGNLAAQILVNSKRLRTEEKLRRYRGRLESLVDQRTQQLAKANTSLKREIQLRERSESAFRESEERYRKLYENAPFGIFHTALQPEGMRSLSANPAMARMLGYSSSRELLETVNHAGIADSVLADPLDKRRRVLREVLKSKGWVVYEQRLRRKDGSLMVAQQRVRAVRDGDGRPRFIEGFVEDITQKRMAEQESKKLNNKLITSQRREALGILAGGIAHDFNNLLSPIMGFAELARNQLPGDHPVQAKIGGILRASMRARDLAQQILTFSRQKEQEFRPVLVQRLAAEAVKLLRSSFPPNIRIRTEIDEHCEPVSADPTQIHQVLMNLATNAFHAMKPDGGDMTIRMRSVVLEKPEFPGFPNAEPGPYVELSVEDTGCGIDPATVEKIFDPYFTTRDAGEGTGLGLAVVQGIVKNHKGAIAVGGSPGGGAVFKIYLPVQRGDIEESLDDIEETVLLGFQQRVMIVDDADSVRDLMREMLEFCNYEVETVEDGESALNLLKSGAIDIDLVIADLNMPGMTGLQLAREITAIRPELPVILCTGHSEALGQEHFEATSVRRLLLKPVGLRALSKLVGEILGGEDNPASREA
ncbi:MAG: ATP-binding protein [Desulfobacterales bacterium]